MKTKIHLYWIIGCFYLIVSTFRSWAAWVEKSPDMRWKQAVRVETQMASSLEMYLQYIREPIQQPHPQPFFQEPILFPSIRQCNEALATFGDSGELIRALKLFGSMRKATSSTWAAYKESSLMATTTYPDITIAVVPHPTLVTYSTLMSRAVALGKSRVALRLWRLMMVQNELYGAVSWSHNNHNNTTAITSDMTTMVSLFEPIVPDIRAVNILMNAFAKLADVSNAWLLMHQLFSHGNQTIMRSLEGIQETNSSLIPEEQGQQPPGISTSQKNLEGSKSFAHDLILAVPPMQPNTITYNTLIDACHRAGDLDRALEALAHMRQWTQIRPDPTTYTSLISTVARKSTRTSGAKDPDIAFALMEEMIQLHNIRPNGMTYCALIDVCGRCRRSDLALKVLRMMLRRRSVPHTHENRRRSKTTRSVKESSPPKGVEGDTVNPPTHFHEVGAWTAAINACGKSGRIDTAIRLFHTMQKFGVKPNAITCGCLMDCLLRRNYYHYSSAQPASISEERWYVGELLDILRFMKEEGIVPTEVMYTSLMRYAESMTILENIIEGNKRRKNRKGEIISFVDTDSSLLEMQRRNTDATIKTKMEQPQGPTKAIDLYTELMLSLISPSSSSSVTSSSNTKSSDSKSTLVKVFLVFQQMRAIGTEPDLASYNALLGACSRAGDISRLFDVLKRIHNDGLIPDNTSWKEMVRGIGKTNDVSGVTEMWKWALSYRAGVENGNNPLVQPWSPNIDAFEALLLSYWKQASNEESMDEQRRLYECIFKFYLEAKKGDKSGSMGFHSIRIDLIHSSRKAMPIISQVSTILGIPSPSVTTSPA